MKISIVAPIHNEAESIPFFYAEVGKSLASFASDYEIIAVDDGSTDESYTALRALSEKDPRLKIIRFRANEGQTPALMAGIRAATGDVIVPIDSDLENDPADIPRLVAVLEEGPFDIVSGWRKGRWKDQGFTRRFPSIAANYLISKITGLTLHDHGCTLKAYRRKVFDGVELYGDMHRFIAAYLFWKGATVTERVVAHRPRRFGRSHYGMGRIIRVLLDLVVIKFLNTYMNHPMRFFGGIGLITFVAGAFAGVAAILLKLFHIRDFVSTPLPLFSAFGIIVSVQLIMMGIIAEMLMRVYYESQGKKPYVIEETLNLS